MPNDDKAPTRFAGPRQLPNDIGPGAGCVDHDGRSPALFTCRHHPCVALSLHRGHLRIALHLAARAANAFQKTGVDSVHVQVVGIGLVNRRRHLVGTQNRNPRARFLAGDELCMGVERAEHFPVRVERIQLPGGGDHHGAPWLEKRVISEPAGRVTEKIQAGAREAAHLLRSVAGHVKGSRPSRGVVARLGFALKDDHLSMRGEPIAHRSAGNSGTDDDEIGLNGGGGGAHGAFRVVRASLPPRYFTGLATAAARPGFAKSLQQSGSATPGSRYSKSEDTEKLALLASERAIWRAMLSHTRSHNAYTDSSAKR